MRQFALSKRRSHSVVFLGVIEAACEMAVASNHTLKSGLGMATSRRLATPAAKWPISAAYAVNVVLTPIRITDLLICTLP